MITNTEIKSEIEKLPLSQELLQYYKEKLGIKCNFFFFFFFFFFF